MKHSLQTVNTHAVSPSVFLAVSLIFLLYAQSASSQNAQKRLPNIIYIYADDLGYGELGAYGQKKIRTPHLDQFASEGIRFTTHYTSAPVCAPARCMLLTGRHSGHSFIRGNYELGGFRDDKEGGQMPLPEGTVTIAKLLKEAGYTTGVIGKWGLGMTGSSGHPNQQGFDYFYGYLDQKQAHNYYPTHLWENERWDTLANSFIEVHRKPVPNPADFDYYKGEAYAVDKITEKAKGFIERNQAEPFFLYLPYTIPHVSLQVHDEEVQKYVGEFPERPYLGEKGYAQTRDPLATYAAMISYLDQQVGEVIAHLKLLGLEGETVVFFSSDNGPTTAGGVDPVFFNSTGGFRGGKGELYEGGIRVPFMARWPGKIPAGNVSDRMTIQYDMFATLCELAGITAPKNDGVSLLPELTGHGSPAERPYLYFEFPERGGQLAIRFERYKAVKMNIKADKNSRWELYDLVDDPYETTDIASAHPDLVGQLDAIVKKEHRGATVREWEFIDPKFE